MQITGASPITPQSYNKLLYKSAKKRHIFFHPKPFFHIPPTIMGDLTTFSNI